jgi:hypothetical protein
MNEQIKQLYLESIDDRQEFCYQRFAELIVREDMDVVAKKCASPTAYNALAEHWGIEE